MPFTWISVVSIWRNLSYNAYWIEIWVSIIYCFQKRETWEIQTNSNINEHNFFFVSSQLRIHFRYEWLKESIKNNTLFLTPDPALIFTKKGNYHLLESKCAKEYWAHSSFIFWQLGRLQRYIGADKINGSNWISCLLDWKWSVSWASELLNVQWINCFQLNYFHSRFFHSSSNFDSLSAHFYSPNLKQHIEEFYEIL